MCTTVNRYHNTHLLLRWKDKITNWRTSSKTDVDFVSLVRVSSIPADIISHVKHLYRQWFSEPLFISNASGKYFTQYFNDANNNQVWLLMESNLISRHTGLHPPLPAPPQPHHDHTNIEAWFQMLAPWPHQHWSIEDIGAKDRHHTRRLEDMCDVVHPPSLWHPRLCQR